jgi:soluble cytochrome b562
MGAPCNTCRHHRRDEIERAYLADVLSKSAIVRKFRIGGKHEASSRRCLNHHMAEDKQRILLDLKRTKEQQIATELSEVADDDIEIKGGLKRIVREIDGILQRAKANNDDGMALTALRDMRGTLLDLAKIMGQLREVSTVEVKIVDAPQWQQLREILGQVFAEHPEAGAAFLRRTRQLKLTFDGDA